MFYACAARFDVTENLEKILVFRWSKHGPGATAALSGRQSGASTIAAPQSFLSLWAILHAAAISSRQFVPVVGHRTMHVQHQHRIALVHSKTN